MAKGRGRIHVKPGHNRQEWKTRITDDRYAARERLIMLFSDDDRVRFHTDVSPRMRSRDV